MSDPTRSGHDPPHRRGTSTVASEIGSGLDENGVLRRRRVDEATTPQRSSLRRALSDSLALSKRATTISLPPPNGSGSARAGRQAPAKQIRYRARSVIGRPTTGITTTVRSSKATHVSSVGLGTRRNSLRIAIRESLKTAETGHGYHGLLANHLKLTSVEPVVRDPVPIKELKIETRRQFGEEGNNRRHTSQLLNSETKAVLHAVPQRSSLRRAVRESLCATAQTSSLTDTLLDDTNSSRRTAANGIVEVSLPTLDGQNRGGISSLGSSTAANHDILPGIDNNGQAPSVGSRASLISYPPPRTPKIARLSTTLTSRKKLARESTPLTDIPTFPSSLSVPKSASPGSVAGYQLPPHEGKPATNISDNGQLQSGKDVSQQAIPTSKRGWYRVQNIVNETPSGLYLVEWEGRDPRTGAKWPASWVDAKNISASALYEWEKKKENRTDGE
ncbi:hypothetical protein F5Y14DRAFT_163406 [Nemania sp. NC0429]|nr:hypothetical protein F5Y14DRAFT_163406 [Nemania sp. NC0429]